MQTSNIKEENSKQIQNYKSQNNMNNMKVYDLRERLFNYGVRILEICKMLPVFPECERIRKQLAGAGTSAGANYEEADGALTKKDFLNKVGISRKEAKESRFWLRIIAKVYIKDGQIDTDIKETEEIINILSAILINSGYRKRQ